VKIWVSYDSVIDCLIDSLVACTLWHSYGKKYNMFCYHNR
jgi:hypothetical protein